MSAVRIRNLLVLLLFLATPKHIRWRWIADVDEPIRLANQKGHVMILEDLVDASLQNFTSGKHYVSVVFYELVYDEFQPSRPTFSLRFHDGCRESAAQMAFISLNVLLTTSQHYPKDGVIIEDRLGTCFYFLARNHEAGVVIDCVTSASTTREAAVQFMFNLALLSSTFLSLSVEGVTDEDVLLLRKLSLQKTQRFTCFSVLGASNERPSSISSNVLIDFIRTIGAQEIRLEDPSIPAEATFFLTNSPKSILMTSL